jgi:hypothetical protein
MRAVSRYGAFTYMNKGNWFLTWRGPSKVNAFDAGNKITRKRIVNRSFLFTMNNKLAKGRVDVKLNKTDRNVYAYRIKKQRDEINVDCRPLFETILESSLKRYLPDIFNFINWYNVEDLNHISLLFFVIWTRGQGSPIKRPFVLKQFGNDF